MERAYRFTVHPTKLGRKPNTDDEKNEIYQNMGVVELTIKSLCEIVEAPNSWTITPKVFVNNTPLNENLLSVTGFMLDFDLNSNPNEIIERFKDYGILPNFYYTSHSDTEEYRKFRVGIMLDQEATNVDTAKQVSTLLLHHFPADISCVDNARIFWGGKKSFFLTEEPSTLDKILLGLTSNKVFDKILYYDNKKTVPLLYNTNKDTGKLLSPPSSFQKGELDEFTYLRKLRNNDFNYDLLKERVRVFNEFVNGEIRLDYPQLRNLAMSMKWLQGGLKLMKKSMNLYNDKVKNIKNIDVYSTKHFKVLKDIKEEDYHPVELDYISPYPEDHGLGNPINVVRNQAHKIEVIEKINKINLEDGEKILLEIFEKVTNTVDTDIHIIKAPVGLGKTRLLRDLTNVTICGSTHSLIAELACEMTAEVHVVPEIPRFSDSKINEQISYLYDAGLGVKARQLITEIAMKLGSKDSVLAIDYMGKIDEAKTTNKTLLTTHQRSFYHQSKHDTIIYDEDCLASLVATNQLDLSELYKVMVGNDCMKEELTDIYISLKKSEKKVLLKTEFNSSIIDGLIDTLSTKSDLVSNIIDFFNSDYYYVEEFDTDYSTKIIVHYVKYRDFPKDKKIVILSSTINTNIYVKRFGFRVQTHEIPEINGVGDIIQFTKFSNSKQSLNSRSKVDILKKVNDDFVITFKEESNFFNEKHYQKNSIKNVYFGNCRGYNLLTGQNIHVVGTYHRNQIYYFFLAKYAGIDLDFKKEIKPRNQIVTWKGLRFNFYAFDNLELRQIQFACIEEELIQAVGRARTIRHQCSVYVYSSFPLIISDRYITNGLEL
jgi:hypothetical protein